MKSTLEHRFNLTWAAVHGQPLIEEARLIPGRKFRCDYVHPETKTVIELEGGIWTGGRHGTGKGMEDDCFKYLELTLLGYTVIRLTSKQICVVTLEKIRDFIRGKSN